MPLLTTGALLGGAALGAGSSMVGSALGMIDNQLNRRQTTVENARNREFTAGENRLSREFNAEQAQLARDFEKEMSSTAYQRGVADMRAAGINPALAGGAAGGASTPTAVSASSGGSGGSMVGSSSHGISAPSIDSLLKAMVTTALKDPDDVIHNASRQAEKTNARKVKEMKEAMDSFDENEWNAMLERMNAL